MLLLLFVSCSLPQDVSEKTGVLLCWGGKANATDSLLYNLYLREKIKKKKKCLHKSAGCVQRELKYFCRNAIAS